jgi:hypothetical protein
MSVSGALTRNFCASCDKSPYHSLPEVEWQEAPPSRAARVHGWRDSKPEGLGLKPAGLTPSFATLTTYLKSFG